MITVCLWLWKGWRPIYTAEHVNTAARMLRDYAGVPHRTVCITDMPAGITECETFPLWPEPPGMVTTSRPNCWRRIRLFDPGISAQLGPRILSLDCDMVAMQSLRPLLECSDPFKIAKGHFALYNGSMWIMDAGVHPHVWNKFDPARSARQARAAMHPRRQGVRMVGSDQVWLSLQIPNAPTWGRADGLMSYAKHSVTYRDSGDARVWFFAGGVKPWSKQCRHALPRAYRRYMEYWRGGKAHEPD